MRVESDSMGQVFVPVDHLWGAQTQRSLEHFSIGSDRMPSEVVHALAILKRASAAVNRDLGRLKGDLADLITQTADEVAGGVLDDDFPLYVWQTGSGTQTNMNVNEVIANRAAQLAGQLVGTKQPVHPNDHVNMSQSSNDAFPSASHIATVVAVTDRLVPAVSALRDAIRAKAIEWVDVVKIGRTHLQDATPLTVGQEWSGWAEQLTAALEEMRVRIDRRRSAKDQQVAQRMKDYEPDADETRDSHDDFLADHGAIEPAKPAHRRLTALPQPLARARHRRSSPGHRVPLG